MINPIDQTKAWVQKVVIGFNFCPFAFKEAEKGSIRYHLSAAETLEDALQDLLKECRWLDIMEEETETSLLIFEKGFQDFEDYLDLLDLAEAVLYDYDYEGIYQIASFHPHYCFDNSDDHDAANYSNRSPYPMLHLLREASLEKALKHHLSPEKIPEQNIRFCREKGLEFMKKVLEDCRHST